MVSYYGQDQSSVVVDIHIPADRYVALYKGQTRYVQARSRDGRYIRFPGNILQKFVGHHGVYGTFEIHFNNKGKFQSIKQLA